MKAIISILYIAFSAITLTCLTVSCSQPKSERLYNEVMQIHDDVMPEISTINSYQQRIKKIIEGLGEMDSEPINRGISILNKLNEAENAMWDWMHRFGDEYESLSQEEQKIIFLESEKIKISEVSLLMRSSIAEAKNYVNQF